MLKSASSGEAAAVERLTAVIEEVRNAMFLTGSRDVNELRKAPLVITGATLQWLTQRGFDPAKYATRSSKTT
jgi:isopentenyl-diphosphate delta-isomerase